MKISSLSIKNFKAIQYLKIENLSEFVLIVGANGVGKSTVFDSIRFIHSCYADGLRNWLAEFQLNIETLKQDKVARNKSLPSEIEIEIELTKSEVKHLKNQSDRLIEKFIINESNNYLGPMTFPINPLANSQLNKVQEKQSKEYKKTFFQLLKKERLVGKAIIDTRGVHLEENIALKILLTSINDPNLGIIDFHGPNRSYNRENINSLNVNFVSDNNYAINALYNSQSKYSNIKNELVNNYLKALIAKEGDTSKYTSLNNSIKDLFSNFFPGKEFIGVQIGDDSSIQFLIKLSEGSNHDIDDLSSGEKEIVFGYLRMRNNTQKKSVILIDEPELHLNPKLAKNLPAFYANNLGKDLETQIWLITHSDAILNEAIRHHNYNIYHLQEPQNLTDNQAIKINPEDELGNILFDLLGSFPLNYNPNNKVILCESENSEFDKDMITKLFPAFAKEVTLVSLGGKSQVIKFHKILDELHIKGVLKKKFYSITDKDAISTVTEKNINHFCWPTYHIENFLLEPKFILKILNEAGINKQEKPIFTEKKIEDALKKIAEDQIDNLLRIKLQEFINNKFISYINISEVGNKSLSDNFFESIVNNIRTLNNLPTGELTLNKIKLEELKIKIELKKSLNNATWKEYFIGRDILVKFCSSHCNGLNYIVFIHLIISKMAQEKFEPLGMKQIIEKIKNAK